MFKFQVFFERPFSGMCVGVCQVNYKGRRTVEEQEGVVNTHSREGEVGQLMISDESFTHYRPVFVLLIIY